MLEELKLAAKQWVALRHPELVRLCGESSYAEIAVEAFEMGDSASMHVVLDEFDATSKHIHDSVDPDYATFADEWTFYDPARSRILEINKRARAGEDVSNLLKQMCEEASIEVVKIEDDYRRMAQHDAEKYYVQALAWISDHVVASYNFDVPDTARDRQLRNLVAREWAYGEPNGYARIVDAVDKAESLKALREEAVQYAHEHWGVKLLS